jgi:putative transcription factor
MRDARNKMKLPLSVLAEKLAEKESFLDRIENQKTHPSQELARKIEKELGIIILEESSSAPMQDDKFKPSGSKKGLTLGDILEIEQKKKKNK